MSNEMNFQATFLERLGDSASNLINGFIHFLGRMLGSTTEAEIRKVGYLPTKNPDQPYQIKPGSILDRINQFEKKMEALTDSELKESATKMRERLKNNETLEDLLPEAFAAVREAGRRTKGMRHYDVQMVGGIILHRRGIAEMVTGEGKTLVATLPAFLNALTGKGVHVVTVNDYLARRDCEWMLPIYSALGLSAGFIQSDMESEARMKAYNCDITYGTSNEFGFDYLRDNMKLARNGDNRFHPFYQQVQRELNFAVIDEVDNILIDEARTPLIIAGSASGDLKLYETANQVAIKLTAAEKSAQAERMAQMAAGTYVETEEEKEEKKKSPGPKGIYFDVREKERTCHLTDKGIRLAEELVGVESFFTMGNTEWPHLIDNALKAHHLYQRDRHYMVMEHEGERKVIIIDEFTGRALFGRQWSDGLHQAVEAKHKSDGVKIKEENQTLATITLQNYFKLYKKISGMTGTASTEAGEFWKIYTLEVVPIPTNRSMKRINNPDLIYLNIEDKWDAIVTEIDSVHKTGRPILIGTTDVAKSEMLASLLKRKGIRYELLNAKPENVTRESEIVAQAGRMGAVTIATNMAGRGTDIILGGNPEYLAWAKLKSTYASRLDVPDQVWKQTVDEIEAQEKMREAGRKVAEIGGLHIIGTERHESRRIDNQLRGRAGRQGDPGSSQFFVSLTDDLMRLYGGEWVASVLTRFGAQAGEPIAGGSWISKRIQACQKRIEEIHFEQRKHLLDYDEVMDVQRKEIYTKRQAILNDANCKIQLFQMMEVETEQAIETYLAPDYGSAEFAKYASAKLGVELDPREINSMSWEEANNYAHEMALNHSSTVVQDILDENLSIDDDPKDWKWKEVSRILQSRYNLKLNDRELKKIGRDEIEQILLAQIREAVQVIPLDEGSSFFDPEYGVNSLQQWLQRKFHVQIPTQEIDSSLPVDVLTAKIVKAIKEAYVEREVNFPIEVAMNHFMAEKNSQFGSQKYDREGLLHWAKIRFGVAAESLTSLQFRMESRSKIFAILKEVSTNYYSKISQWEIDNQLNETLAGTKIAEPADAKELCDWMKSSFDLTIPVEALAQQPRNVIQNILWNFFDLKYRPEIHNTERNLLLETIDNAWKQHLLSLDHLRSSISLYGVAQSGDPRIIFKKEGMKEFEGMWKGIRDRVTDSLFRMSGEDNTDVIFMALESLKSLGVPVENRDPNESNETSENRVDGKEFESPPLRRNVVSAMLKNANLAGTKANPESALSSPPPEVRAKADQENNDMTTNSSEGKKREPIRNQMQKIGRNDLCPCGSGKKYKNCHMKQTTHPS